MDHFIFEIIGYAASTLIAISLMMSSIIRLRVINLIGAVVFTIYGILIQSYPIAILNFFIVIMDSYYLYELTNTNEYFKFLKVRPDANYLAYFLEFHKTDIQKYLPNFVFTPQEDQIIFFILRNLVPAGLFIGEINPQGHLQVKLDFVIPGYRDLKVGRYLYQQKEFFQTLCVKKIISVADSKKHEKYLKRMGFVAVKNQSEDNNQFELVL